VKRFEEWLAEGPLAREPLSERELLIAKVAYNEGASGALSEERAALERILQGAGAMPEARA